MEEEVVVVLLVVYFVVFVVVVDGLLWGFVYWDEWGGWWEGKDVVVIRGWRIRIGRWRGWLRECVIRYEGG